MSGIAQKSVRNFDHDALRRARLVAVLTQEEVADRLGVRRSNYVAFETGRRSPSPAMFVAIAAAVAVRPHSLVTTEVEDVTLRDLREYAGFSRRQLAEHLGQWDKGRRYRSLERGERSPIRDEIARLANALQVTHRQVEDACRSRVNREHLADPDWLAAQRAAGVSIADLASELGCSIRRMRAVLQRHGVRTSRAPRPEQLNDPDWLGAQRNRGATAAEIADQVGGTVHQVRGALQRHGLTVARPQLLVDPEWLAIQRATGVSIAKLAAQLGCSPRRMRTVLQHHDMSTSRARGPAQLDDADWLAGQRNSGATIAEIADQVGGTVYQVRGALQRHGLTVARPPKFERLYDRDWIVAQVEAGRTQADIAHELGCGKSAASRAVRRFVGWRHPELHDVDWLAEQVRSRRSLRRIAQIVGCDHKSVAAALERHDIARPAPQRTPSDDS